MSNEPAPERLKEPGRELWRRNVKKYQLRPDELVILEYACVARDLEIEFERAWVALGCPYMSKGSTGQDVEHPLIGSRDKQAKTVASLFRQLNLPDDAAAAPGSSEAARGAATSRWSRGS